MKFFDRVKKIVERSDLLLETVDARFPELTRHKEIESIIKRKRKKVIIVLNKSDLVSKTAAAKSKKIIEKEFETAFVSSKSRKGMKKLRERISKYRKGKTVVGVIGYPNTGKSSLINALTGRHSAKTSSTAGFTRGEQFIKATEKVFFIDSPGIIPFQEWDEFGLALIGAKNANQLKQLIDVAEELIKFIKEKNLETLHTAYRVEVKGKGTEEILEEMAFNKNRLKKGGKADLDAVSRMLLSDWQKGKLKV